jgi:Flp pilus assembly protein TadD
MRKINCKPYVLVVLVAVLLSSCAGLNKMKKNADQINFKVNPEVLEAHASEVDLAIDARFPAKYFDKKATLTATPVLKYADGETKFKAVSVQGENVEANNKVIGVNGGSVSYKDMVGYDKAMAKSELYVNISASKGKKTVDFAPIKIGDGVLATSEKIVNMPKAILGVQREANTTGKYDANIDAFQRIVPDEMMADIHYLINRSNLRKDETGKDDIVALENYTKKANEDERIDLKQVEVSAYASPDGTIDFNTDLAAKRKETSSEFLAKKLKEAGVNVELKTRYTPEDWDGFKELMEKSNIQDKELILRVLSMYNDPEVREREIKNLSETFTAVADEILPQLRRAKLATSVDFIGKTDDELKTAAKANPSSLNPAELLYAATLFEDLNEQLSVYNSFSKIYANDWRGPNNAGYVLVKQWKYADAKPLFEKAEKLKNDEPIVKNNIGATTLNAGDIANAETLFGAATGAGEEVNYNMGIVSVKKAEYAKAVKYFSKYKDVNSGLAKLLAGDNNGAIKDLDACTLEGCYMTEYFKAVVGARTAKETLLFESLKTACDMNAKLKEVAKTDMEFSKYFDDAKFKAIVD